MKNRQVLMGILAIVLVFGLIFVGCEQATNGEKKIEEEKEEEKDKQVIIKINNVSGFDAAMIWVFAELPEANQQPINSAVGYNTVEGNALQVLLTVPENNTYGTNVLWQGGGSYYVAIIKVENNQLTSSAWGYNEEGQFIKVSFDSPPVILDFGKFATYP